MSTMELMGRIRDWAHKEVLWMQGRGPHPGPRPERPKPAEAPDGN